MGLGETKSRTMNRTEGLGVGQENQMQIKTKRWRREKKL